MASIKRGDTWPPLRGAAADEDGLLDLTTAQHVILLLKKDATVIRGTIMFGGTFIAGTLYPPPGDDDGFNWSYTWRASDTAVVGNYGTELEVTWDAGTTPPQVETVPNGENPLLQILQDNG